MTHSAITRPRTESSSRFWSTVASAGDRGEVEQAEEEHDRVGGPGAAQQAEDRQCHRIATEAEADDGLEPRPARKVPMERAPTTAPVPKLA